MAEITYSSVKALLEDAEELQDAVRCTFRCPVTEASVVATGPLEKGRELADVCTGDASLLGSLRSALSGLFSAALGSSDPVETPVRLAEGVESPYSEEERKAGIVLAFKSVSDRFVYDPQGERWVTSEGASELMTDFDRQLRLAPIRAERDRQIASRMLVEIARADGQVTPTEWSFLASFIPGDLSSVDTFMEKPRLTAEEFATASRGAARDTMVMLAWALAHVDDHLDEAEDERLLGYADKLKVPRERALVLRDHARTHLLETALLRAYPKGKASASLRAEALTLAEQLGLGEAGFAKAEAAFKKRYGLK